eukprot:TRINITY_DN17422_c0_g1_i6.p1 TRINITY_DN17422_c0_g1~~TRINITY_DN17422_c0_g1_i6.p1  ORF type:complete len:139 (+),score=49.80 TRINITY_DN17422_c0_g1_i6:89-505(+)
MAVEYFYDSNGYWRCEGRARRRCGGGCGDGGCWYFEKEARELREEVKLLEKTLHDMTELYRQLKEKQEVDSYWRWCAEWRLGNMELKVEQKFASNDDLAACAKEYSGRVEDKVNRAKKCFDKCEDNQRMMSKICNIVR